MTEPLRIVHLLAPGAIGGAESVVRMLCEGLAGRGHELHVGLTLTADSDDHWLARTLPSRGVRVHEWRLPPRAYLREGRRIVALCRRLQPHVAHTHGYRSDVIGTLALRRRVPVVSTAHGFTRGDGKNRLYEWMQRRAFRRCRTVVAVSRSVAERLVEAGVPSARVRVVQNGWVPSGSPTEREISRRELGLAATGFIVAWVGRLSHEKGLDVLLDAVPQLTDLPVEFAILGEGPEGERLRARCAREPEIADRVRWLGAVPDAGQRLAAFDLLALTSRTEGTPIVLLEAIAADVPIVAAAVGGVPDMIGPGEAFLVPPADPEALSTAIRQAYRDPAGRAERTRAAEVRLRTAFAAGPWLERHEEIYRAAAGLTPGAPARIRAGSGYRVPGETAGDR